MMKKNHLPILLTVLSAAANLILHQATACIFTTEYQVKIDANSNNGATPLTMHCASGDDDLGILKILGTIDGPVSWKLCDNIIGQAIYTCQFWWNGKTKTIQVFNSDFAKVTCGSGTCSWRVLKDGFYLHNDVTKKMDKWHTWP
ncbi:hypothetical protein ABFS82_04G078200 [Erythranthe guttata]